MFITIAPANPVQTAVISVAVIRHVIARVSVRLCSSINFIQKKAPKIGAWSMPVYLFPNSITVFILNLIIPMILYQRDYTLWKMYVF